jgi:hypothetical protein
MMGVRTPETCWVVNKRQVINWRNFASSSLIYLNCMMMHGFTNFKLSCNISQVVKTVPYFIMPVVHSGPWHIQAR